ncbi:MAG: methyltransferase domain-containing protein [Acetatifactor sp.]|nr:methyltransferase domain-containing protein [Acetatifactor sp.]
MKEIKECEICGSRDLVEVLDLGSQPLCDNLIPIGSESTCREYPIKILYCRKCCSAHQMFQVEKETLFPHDYHYRSRFTKDVLSGMRDLVEECSSKWGDLSGKTVIDIGCNDGSLLNFFREKGCITIGVEPTDACGDAVAEGHEAYQEYFVTELAKKIREKHPTIDIITFTNVFAHIDDLKGLMEAVKELSNEKTLLVIENHYMGEIIEKHQFDTFYHEHPRTYSLHSFDVIAKNLGKALLDVQFPKRYGGNIRVYIGDNALYETSRENIEKVLKVENGYFGRFGELENYMVKWKQEKLSEINDLVLQYGSLRAKAFPGRAAILIKLLGLSTEHISKVYEKPGSKKVGNYVPGTRIEIHSDDELFAESDQTLPIINLAWHIPNEIRSYLSENGYKGKVIDIV